MTRGDPDHLSIVIHEIRNPLVGIDAAARVLAAELGPHPGARRAAAIAAEAKELLRLLESVGEAEAASSGRLRSVFVPVDLARCVRETVASTRLDGRPVNVVGADASVPVRADEGRIRQVLRNLLINAAQYSPAGTPIEVAVAVDPRRRVASVRVRDHGPGIPALERRKLFRKFSRLSTAAETRGSGLGLYICKAIVEDHGGKIFYTASTAGSTFAFDIPVRRSARAGDVDGGPSDLVPRKRSRAGAAKGRTTNAERGRTGARASDRGTRREGPQSGASPARARLRSS